MFEVGQSVVCVNTQMASMLSKEKIYTIIAFGSRERPSSLDGVLNRGIVLKEVRSPLNTEGAFDPRRFRPVTRTRDTLSIESFMTIKTGQPEGPRRVVGPVSPKKERA